VSVLADLGELDATAQAQLVARGEATAAELVEAAIGRIEDRNPFLNAVVHERFERARDEARHPLPDGPFRGVPLVLKDCGCASAGDPLHAGTRYLRSRGVRATSDARLTQRFRAAGFVIVGRSNTAELAMSMTTEPVAFGPTRNPWAPDRSPGGSSGGSAAAVSDGMVAIAHGADGGGSIRIPASACGLVGLKPSRGRVPADAGGASWSGLLVEHVLTRTVRDSAAALRAIGGARAGDRAPRRLRVGVLDAPPVPHLPADPDCRRAVQITAAALSELGHEVSEGHPAALGDPAFAGHFSRLVAVACAREVDALAALAPGVPDPELEPATLAAAERGRQITRGELERSADWLERFSERLRAWWDTGPFDLLLSPVLGGPPPPLGWLADPSTAAARAERLLPYVRPFNASGQPAVALPVHWTAEGLPIGVQLVGPVGGDERLLDVAAQLEDALGWPNRRPPRRTAQP
jgi:amidase